MHTIEMVSAYLNWQLGFREAVDVELLTIVVVHAFFKLSC
jgi:hypothetical protein